MSDSRKSKSIALTAAALTLGSAIGANMQSALAAEPTIDPKVTDVNTRLKTTEPAKIDATQIKMEDATSIRTPEKLDASKIDTRQIKVEDPIRVKVPTN